MTIAAVVLIAIALVTVVGTLVSLARDGYRKVPDAPILRRVDDSIWR